MCICTWRYIPIVSSTLLQVSYSYLFCNISSLKFQIWSCFLSAFNFDTCSCFMLEIDIPIIQPIFLPGGWNRPHLRPQKRLTCAQLHLDISSCTKQPFRVYFQGIWGDLGTRGRGFRAPRARNFSVNPPAPASQVSGRNKVITLVTQSPFSRTGL